MPERDEKHVSPATRLLEKRRETAEVEHALSAQKEEFSMKMEGLAQRRQELERKEQTLKQSLQKFDRFLKENDNKKLRALKKAKEERVLIGKKEQQIEELKSECKELEIERDQFRKKLEKYTIYQEYLERVLEFSDEFKDLHEIIPTLTNKIYRYIFQVQLNVVNLRFGKADVGLASSTTCIKLVVYSVSRFDHSWVLNYILSVVIVFHCLLHSFLLLPNSAFHKKHKYPSDYIDYC